MKALAAFALIIPVAAHAQVVVPASILPPAGQVWTGDVNPGQAACRADMRTTFNNVWHINPATGSPPNYLAATLNVITAPITVTVKTNAFIATNTNGVWSSVLTTFQPGQTIPTAGLGTLAAPFNSLQAVYSSNGGLVAGYQAPLLTTATGHWAKPGVGYSYTPTLNPAISLIQPGDEILLANGDYGLVNWSLASFVPVYNTDWLTIAPEPGAKPIIDRWTISAANLIHVLPGVTVSSHVAASATALMLVSGAHDIVSEGMTIANDLGPVDSFTPAFVTANFGTGYDTAGGLNTPCVSFTGGHIYNVFAGAQINNSQSKFENNEIDHFNGDGIDYSSWRTSISFNRLHDGQTSNTSIHYDFIQNNLGPLTNGATYNQFDDVFVAGNKLIRVTDPNLTNGDVYIQGITDFNSSVSRLYVVNNLIVTYSCYGINVSSVQNSVVAYNTIADDTADGGPSHCSPIIQVGIQVHETAAPVTSNLLVIGNVAPGLYNASQDPSVVLTNNVLAGLGQGVEYFLYVNGVPAWYGANATTGPEIVGGNLLLPANEWSLFVNFAPSPTGLVGAYDLHLIPGSPAAQFGQLQSFTPALNQANQPRVIAPGAL